MAQQTAVEWLEKQLDNNLDIKHSWRTKQYIEQAKQMEKEHIIDSYGIGHNDGCAYMTDGKTEFEDAEQYYNETFGNK